MLRGGRERWVLGITPNSCDRNPEDVCTSPRRCHVSSTTLAPSRGALAKAVSLPRSEQWERRCSLCLRWKQDESRVYGDRSRVEMDNPVGPNQVGGRACAPSGLARDAAAPVGCCGRPVPRSAQRTLLPEK